MNDCSSLLDQLRKQQELGEFLRLMDSSHWDQLLLHAKQNLKGSYRSILDLKGVFKNIPAIIIGCGPSLEKNGHLLEKFRSQAILFAGGAALEKIPCRPHFGVAIDPNRPLVSCPYPDIPLCFQARMHPGNRDLFEGERLLSPDGHFPFLNFFSGDEDLFESGWTVGNLMAALGVHFGCDPIICVGMDYCYDKGRKYAFGEPFSLDGLVEAIDRFGKSVWTQSDWLMAVSWMEQFARRHDETTFLNASDGGIPFFQRASLDSLDLQDIPCLEEKISEAISSLPKKNVSKFEKWDESVLRCCDQSKKFDLHEEIVCQELLLPLWQIWKNSFARLEDPFPISFEEKMEIHKKLFFQQVLDRCLALQ